MENLALADWSNIAQVLTTLITFVGILVSIWLSTKALREVQLDRRLRSRPHLAFENGGWRLPIQFIKMGHKVPGLDPEYMKKLFSDLPKDSESVRLALKDRDDKDPKRFGYGRLRNHGGGPALSTHVTWIPTEIWIGTERFDIDNNKREEPLYHRNLNTWPAIPSNIQPGEESSINCIPTFITKDIEKKVTRVNGILNIKCRDTFDVKHVVQQEFYFFTYYGQEKPEVHVTFSSVLSSQ